MGIQAKQVAAAAIAVLVANACGIHGNGVLAEENRAVPGFHAVNVSKGMDARIECGPAQSVRVVGDSNLVGEVRTEVRDGRLEIGFEDALGFWSEIGLKVVVTLPSLDSVEASSGAEVEVVGLNEARFALEASSGADVRPSGQVASLVLDVSGGADVEAPGLEAREAWLEVSGGGQARVRVSETLDLSASGGADVSVLGHPRVLRSEVSSGAEVVFE